MDEFVADRIRRLEHLLASTTDPTKRKTVAVLLAAAKQGLNDFRDFVGPPDLRAGPS